MTFQTFLDAIKAGGRRIHTIVQHLEPWGITLAVLGFLVTFVGFLIELEDRQAERTFRAWNVIFAQEHRETGSSIQRAMEFLNRASDGFLCLDVVAWMARSLSGEGNRRCVIPKKRRESFEEMSFTNARMIRSYLPDARLAHTVLDEANLSGSTLTGANMENARATEADFIGADLSRAHLVEASLNGSKFTFAKFIDANLNHASLMLGDFFAADFSGASMSGVKLIGSTLVNASFDNTKMPHAYLVSANVAGASFNGARLNRAYLDGLKAGCWFDYCTDLRGADLRGASLNRADLRDAVLDENTLKGACGEEVKLPDGFSIPPCPAEWQQSNTMPSPKDPVQGPRIKVIQD